MSNDLINYLNQMKKAKTVAEFDTLDIEYKKTYNVLLNSGDFDAFSMDTKYMEALRQRSFLVRKDRRENKV